MFITRNERDRLENVVFPRYDDLWGEVLRCLPHELRDNGELAAMIITELQKCLICKAKTPYVLYFPPILDQAWHYCLLNSQKYADMCQEAFGRVLHSSTEEVLDLVREKRIITLRRRYFELFGDRPRENKLQRMIWGIQDVRDNPTLVTRPRLVHRVLIEDVCGKRTLTEVPAGTRGCELRYQLEKVLGVPAFQQQLFWRGIRLKDNKMFIGDHKDGPEELTEHWFKKIADRHHHELITTSDMYPLSLVVRTQRFPLRIKVIAGQWESVGAIGLCDFAGSSDPEMTLVVCLNTRVSELLHQINQAGIIPPETVSKKLVWDHGPQWAAVEISDGAMLGDYGAECPNPVNSTVYVICSTVSPPSSFTPPMTITV